MSPGGHGNVSKTSEGSRSAFLPSAQTSCYLSFKGFGQPSAEEM